MANQGQTAQIKALWRYPVKSMSGEEVKTAWLDQRGMKGDRAFALLDKTTGKVASAKNPRLWGGLLDCRAAFEDEADPSRVEISLPNGQTLCSSQADHDELLSGWLGRPVELIEGATQTGSLTYEIYVADPEGRDPLARLVDSPVSAGAASGTFFNFAPLHLLTTASLKRLQTVAPQSRIESGRFRPNILIETEQKEDEFVENEWVGQTLVIGNRVRLQVMVECPRCVVTTLPQSQTALPGDNGVLRAIARHNRRDLGPYGNQACFGVYAQVTQGGPIKPGDPVRII